jgi:MFS family permease
VAVEQSAGATADGSVLPKQEAGEKAAAKSGSFANHDFVKLWAGESVSLIGTQVTRFTMPLVAVLTLNASVTEVGVLNALQFVPVLTLSLLVGVWLDRRRRRPVLIACALGNAVLIGMVPTAAATGVLSMGLLYVVVTLTGLLSMTFDVGALSYMPDLVGRDLLADANGKMQASTAFAGVAGPGLAGVLIGLITAPVTLTVDSVSYLFSALGLIFIGKPEPAPEVPEVRPPVWQSIAEGLRAVWGSRLLSMLLVQSAAANLFFGGYITVFVVYAVRVLHLSPPELGIVLAASAVGSFVGATTAGRTRDRLGLGRAMLINTVVMSAQLAYGWGVGMFNVNSITLRQVVTPRSVLARMNAGYRMVLFGTAPVGMSFGGVLGGTAGLRPALVISLVAMVSPLFCLFFSPVLRLTEMPSAPQESTPAQSAQEG